MMEHFKTLENLRDYIKTLGKFYARPTENGAHQHCILEQQKPELCME